MNTNTKAKLTKLYIPSWGQILQFALLVFWVLFQYRQGNELYSMTLVLLFVVIYISRSKNFVIIAVTVLALILFKTPSLETWMILRESNQNTFQSFRPSISKLFTPNSRGKDVLPKDILQMVSLLQENKITEYRVPNSFSYQTNMQITEAAWPIKRNSTSPYLIYITKDNLDLIGCQKLDKKKDVTLVYCP